MEHENADGALVAVEPSSLACGAEARSVLIRYRVVARGFPAMVHELLTIFDDRAVEFDERHRTRDAMWFRLEDGALRSEGVESTS